MKLNELAPRKGSIKKRMRIGRGIGSGVGKTGGRGGKGQTARSGVRIKGFEGGQMPLHRRLPKRGFKNTKFQLKLNEVNLGKVQTAIDAGKLDANGASTPRWWPAAAPDQGRRDARRRKGRRAFGFWATGRRSKRSKRPAVRSRFAVAEDGRASASRRSRRWRRPLRSSVRRGRWVELGRWHRQPVIEGEK